MTTGMMEPKHNLTLKFNKSLNNLSMDGPLTPLEQTLRTPVDSGPPHGFFNGRPNAVYSNAQYSESDDILTDVDEPNGGGKVTKQYTICFTPPFDQLVMSVYSHILSLPTTTPFLGVIPPSGLASRVAMETMNSLIKNTASYGHPAYDQQSIINNEHLKNYAYQPVFLGLIRKRLCDLCSFQNKVDAAAKLPKTTTVSVTLPSNGTPGTYGHNSLNASSGRQSSISSMSLTDANISNLNSASSGSSIKSRSSSINLRKQSLTRNNSYNSNWLHVGNINSIRQNNGNGPMNNDSMNVSTDSLQSVHDYVPQSMINRSATGNPYPYSQNNPSVNGFNSMMMDYQTPASSAKSSFSNGSTPPPPSSQGPFLNIQIVQNINGVGSSSELDWYNVSQRSRSSSRAGSGLPNPLTINTDHSYQSFCNMSGNNNNNSSFGTLDSPFMSAVTPSEEYGFSPIGNNIPLDSPLPEISNDAGIDLSTNNNQQNTRKDSINIPAQYSLSEKKRESLKLKRGIH